MKTRKNRPLTAGRYPCCLHILLIFLTIFLFLTSSAQAVVWCHDFVIHTLTGQDTDNASPETLRNLLRNLGYKPFNYTLARSLPQAMSHLQPGDILVIGNSHSGVVNLNGTIDHFIQIEGKSGTHYDPQNATFLNLVRRNNSLEAFLNRPIYQKLPLEVWRLIQKAEFSNLGQEFPLVSQGVWVSGDMSVNPKTGAFFGAFINREFNRTVGNRAVISMQGMIDLKTLHLTATFIGSLAWAAGKSDQKEIRFNGTLNLPFSRTGMFTLYKGPADMVFTEKGITANGTAAKTGYELGKKYTGTVVLNLLDARLLPRPLPPEAESATALEPPKSYLTVLAVTSDGTALYDVNIEIRSPNYSTYGVTDPTGRDTFTLPAGTYTIKALPPRDKLYKPAEKTVTVQSGKSYNTHLVLKTETDPADQPDSGQLTVRVMDEAGWFQGAEIIINGLEIFNCNRMVQTATGADGYAANIEPLPPGLYGVIASASGHGTDADRIRVTAGKESSLVLLLPYRLKPLSVGVMDKNSRKALSGVRVEIDLGVTSMTNAQGVAAFKGVPVGQRKGKVSASGYQAAEFSVNIEEETDYLTSTIVYLDPENQTTQTAPAVSAGLTEKERQALQDDLQRWEKILECLEEGKRKYPNYWQDCNGNWTMRDREVEIAHYRKLINDARARLGQAPLAAPSPAATAAPPGPISADRIALVRLNGPEAFGSTAGSAEHRPQNNELLSSGAILRTGRQSTASFRTSANTQVTLQENSRVQVTRKPKGNGAVWQVAASAGTIDVEHQESLPGFDDVIVVSRDGSVTPLNTRYRVIVEPAGTVVEVFQGRVRLESTQILRLNTTGKPSPSQTLDLNTGERAVMLKIAAGPVEKPSLKNLLLNGGFEQGLSAPWESGFYSKKPTVWFNSGNCNSFVELDRQNFHEGAAALHLRDLSKRAPNIYGTMTQKMKVNKNRYYAFSFWAKGNNIASNGALNVAIDPMWRIRLLALPAGSFDWTRFYKTFNSGDRDTIEFRIIFEDTGDVWLDDLRVEELPENYKE